MSHESWGMCLESIKIPLGGQRGKRVAHLDERREYLGVQVHDVLTHARPCVAGRWRGCEQDHAVPHRHSRLPRLVFQRRAL